MFVKENPGKKKEITQNWAGAEKFGMCFYVIL